MRKEIIRTKRTMNNEMPESLAIRFGYMVMKQRPRKPLVPVERQSSVRKEIMSAIEGEPLSAMNVSGIVGIPEKEVYDHLEHIQKTIHKGGRILIVVPAECRKCGFRFRKRGKLKKPGKCPICRGEAIEEPLFAISKA